ncbi:MAG: hypothetical protein M3Q46_13365, partial [Verrucomicrobiota bacterium]|nr:hypothetical protein [Verrucomicrobiota bacterium]
MRVVPPFLSRMICTVAFCAAAGVPPQLPAQEETATTPPASTEESSPEVATTTEDAAAAPDLGTGSFSRTPFRVSVGVREGYDDNVYTTHDNTVDSFFTNANALVEYNFGSPRTK